MPNFNRKLVATYSKVYGAKKELNNEELSVLDKNTWAKVLARLNHLARSKENYTLNKVIGDWFSGENTEYAKEMFDKVVNAYQAIGVNTKELTTINIWSNLSLLDLILQLPENLEHSLTDTASEKQLFDIILATNETFGEKSDHIFATVSKELYPETLDRLSRVYMTLVISYHDLNHFEAISLLVVNFIKSYYCFRFLERDHPELLALFLKPYGINNWKDYLKGILPIASHATQTGDDSGLNYLNLENSPEKEKSKVFLDYLSLVDEIEYSVNTDFLHARSKPLFKVGEDNYLILDAVLAVNRIYNSMFFELLRLAEKNKKLNARYKDFFSLYTYDFIEKYLSYTVLGQIFSKTPCYQISGEQIVHKYGIDTEPDYYVRNGNKVFLFEVKGSIVTGGSKQSFSFETLEAELKSKYLYNAEDDENKAIAQLAERIRILFNGEAAYDEHYRPENIRIYPILIVSELALTTPGVNYVFNQWFWDEINKHELLRANKHRINDLVIMDLDILVLYSDQLAQRGVFESLINDYYTTIDKKKVRPKFGVKPTTEYMEALMMKSFHPFNGFLRDKMKMKTPGLFLEFGEDLLKG